MKNRDLTGYDTQAHSEFNQTSKTDLFVVNSHLLKKPLMENFIFCPVWGHNRWHHYITRKLENILKPLM